jgi:2-polyprenyl-3-methyl-5-hydroxy-6-metoxy-1,4-benzoquinol methylase
MERQPTRSKRIREERRFDKTQLRRAGHGRSVHRDYLAHALRWRFVALDIDRYVEDVALRYGWVAHEVKQNMSILDVGCGQDQPLLYVLGARMQTVPDAYLGIDLNRIAKKSTVRWAEVWDEFNFVDNWPTVLTRYTPFDVAVCLEVVEHMAPADGARLLEGLFGCLREGGALYLSTPVFNGMAAANHVFEYTAQELFNTITNVGFTVERRYGTFASKPDILDAMHRAQDAAAIDVYNRLSKWFGGDVLACVMAPLYADASRNILWVCRKPMEEMHG